MGRSRHHLKGGYTSSWIRPTTRIAIYLRDGLCCVYCMQDWSVNGLTIDHIVSRSVGGKNEHTNLASACMRCNALKRAAGTQEAFAQCLGVAPKGLEVRLSEQAQPLTQHLKRRANHLVRYPPPWLRELRKLNERWSPQQVLFPLTTRVLPMIIVEQPEDKAAPNETGATLPGDDPIPF